MRLPDILILGVGRSGTSKVAEILHQHFAVCFGHDESLLKDFRGETVYEDAGLKKMIKRVVKGEVGIDSWLRKFDATHKDCEAELTGVKLLDFAALPLADLLLIAPRLVIRTHRPFRSCVESWVRYRHGGIQTDEESRRWAERYVRERESEIRSICGVLKDLKFQMLEFYFDPEVFRWEDEKLKELIGPAVENL